MTYKFNIGDKVKYTISCSIYEQVIAATIVSRNIIRHPIKEVKYDIVVKETLDGQEIFENTDLIREIKEEELTLI